MGGTPPVKQDFLGSFHLLQSFMLFLGGLGAFWSIMEEIWHEGMQGEEVLKTADLLACVGVPFTLERLL